MIQGAILIIDGMFKALAVRDGNLITRQQWLSGAATQDAVSKCLAAARKDEGDAGRSRPAQGACTTPPTAAGSGRKPRGREPHRSSSPPRCY